MMQCNDPQYIGILIFLLLRAIVCHHALRADMSSLTCNIYQNYYQYQTLINVIDSFFISYIWK